MQVHEICTPLPLGIFWFKNWLLQRCFFETFPHMGWGGDWIGYEWGYFFEPHDG